jgi:hypothetical protein
MSESRRDPLKFLRQSLNRGLDRVVRPQVRLLGRQIPTFQVFGGIGALLAALLGAVLAAHRGLSPWMMVAIGLAAVSVLLGLTMITKVISGEERIVNYHHQVTVWVVTAVLLRLANHPVLPYLDVAMLGVGLFIACGRIGCLMMGCCHGRPHSWGVRYAQGHVAFGFPSTYVGLRLYPVQAVESLWLFGVVLGGSLAVLRDQPPGAALSGYVVAYCTGRFCLEYARGDPERPYYGGFSGPQWTSVLLVLLVVVAEGSALLPWQPWHAGAAAALLVSMVAVGLSRRRHGGTFGQVLNPRHVGEFIQQVERVRRRASHGRRAAPGIEIGCTSLGIRVSASRLERDAEHVDHYALSCRDRTVDARTAEALADLICRTWHPAASREIVQGGQGVYHLLVRTPRGRLRPGCRQDASPPTSARPLTRIGPGR